MSRADRLALAFCALHPDRARKLVDEMGSPAAVLRALRRDTVLGEVSGGAGASLLRVPRGGGLAGTGYGRLGASVTGKGARSQLYGTVGGAIGYAVGGPVGALLGGMLGGWLGGRNKRTGAARCRGLRGRGTGMHRMDRTRE